MVTEMFRGKRGGGGNPLQAGAQTTLLSPWCCWESTAVHRPKSEESGSKRLALVPTAGAQPSTGRFDLLGLTRPAAMEARTSSAFVSG